MARSPLLRYQCIFAIFIGLSVSGLSKAEPLFPAALNIPQGEIQLRIVVLSVQTKDAAKWMLEHDGTSGALEQRLMLEAENQHAAEVTRLSVTGKPGTLKKEAPEKIKVITQGSASWFWREMEEAQRTANSLPKPTALLEFADKQTQHPVGSELEATVQMDLVSPGANVEVKFTYTRQPEERPTTNWPLPYGLRAPRVILCPWTIETKCSMPPGQAVLIGAQMEPPHEGEVNTGRVWFALAQLDSHPDLLPALALPSKTPGKQEANTVAWIFSVPNQFASAWIAVRKDTTGDAATLRQWLATADAKEGPVLAALMQLRQEKGGRSKVTSRRFWEDGTGFEPGGEGPTYHPVIAEGKELELKHEMESEVVFGPVGVVADPFSSTVANADPKTPQLIDLNATFTLPPHPARWQRVKSAMEKTADNDPAAMELAALGEEEITLSSRLVHGEVGATAVWPQGDRTRVAFLRVQRSQATVPVETRPVATEPSEDCSATLWLVDTEVKPWLPRIFTQAFDDTGLAAEVLAGISTGKTHISGLLLSESRRQHFGGVSRQGEGCVLDYLNTHPHPGGLPYNPRQFYRTEPGWKWRFGARAGVGGADFNVDLSAPTAPTIQRRWGVRLEQDTQRTPADSGIDLPVQSTHSLRVNRFIPLDQPVVLAVSQYELAGTQRLRWTIARANLKGKPKLPRETDMPRFILPADYIGNWMVAALLSVKSTETAMHSGNGLMNDQSEKALFQSVFDGKARLLDMNAITTEFDTNSMVTATRNTTFLEPRAHKLEWEHPTIPRDPPPGTKYSDQIYLMPHVGGFELSFGQGEVQLVHDGAIEVVTDTLPGYYESPIVNTEYYRGAPMSVSVQRAVFKPHRTGATPLPKGRCLILPWNGAKPLDGETWVILLRAMPSLRGL